MNQRIKKFPSPEKIALFLIFSSGVLLRLRQYLTGRSLWVDEAMLALNIVNRGFAGLFKPLDYDQGAPIGFLLVEKFFNSILGKSEYALRLFPLLAGLASLWLFYLLLKQTTNKAGLWVALALFAINPRLVYYSSEVKQYILDVTIAIILLLIAAPLFQSHPSRKNFFALAVAGLLSLWLSHPSLFMLAGIGFVLALYYLLRRDYSSLWAVLGMGALWLINLGCLYWLTLGNLRQNAYMREYWQGAFVPMPPWSDLSWYANTFNENIHVQFGIPYAVWLVFVLMLIGWIVLFVQKRVYAAAFAGILFFTLLASSFGLYPMLERMTLFLVPPGLILIGKSFDALYEKLQPRQVVSTIAVLALSGFLLYGPFTTSLEYFIQPKYFEHIRPAMVYLRESWKDGDALYVSEGAVPAFRFYAPGYGLEKIRYESGVRADYQNPQSILQRLDQFKGRRRVWILFSHVYERGDFNERDFALTYLNQIGEKKREFRRPGTSVFLYLYDLGSQ